MLTALRQLPARIRAMVSRRRLDRDFDEEWAAHVAMASDDYAKRGLGPDEARRAAVLRLGGRTSLAQQHRDARGLPLIESVWQDARLAVRMLGRAPWFAATAIAALALGIGANTAIVSAVDAVLLAPLPYEAPEQLVGVWEQPAPGTRKSVSPGVFRDWRDESASFEALSVISPEDANLTGGGGPERVRGLRVSSSYLDILRLRPMLGPGFRVTDDRPGEDTRVVILSHGLWQRRFGGDPTIVGRVIEVNLEHHRVVGVLPSAPALPDPEVEVLRPYVLTDDPSHTTRENHLFFVIGRLRPGIDVSRAQAELSALKQRLTPQYPAFKRDWDYRVVALREQIVGDSRRTLLTVMAAVGFVLLIACANVANLLLARATSRQPELTLRGALGASRWRLVRQMLTESVVLAALGAALGLGLAFWAIRLLNGLDLTVLARAHEIRFAWRVVAVAVGLSLLTALLFGLAPALQAARRDARAAINALGRSRVGEPMVVRSSLIVGEIALSLVLLTGAALLLQSLVHLLRQPSGFDPRHTVVMEVYPPKERYPTGDDAAAFFHRVFERLEAMPGVEAAGLATSLPMTGPNFGTEIRAEGITPADPGHHVRWDFIAGDYFHAMGIPLVRGRMLTTGDNSTVSPRAAVINDTLARTVFGRTEPIGRRVRFWGEWWEVVGVAGSVRQEGLAAPPAPRIYLPQAFNRIWHGGAVIVRGTSDAAGLGPAVSREIQAIDAEQPVADIRPLEEIVRKSTARLRLTLMLLAGLAATAVALAAIGLFGVMAYGVQRRVPELGLRIALGARRADILRLVMGRGVGLTLLGIAAGTIGARAFARVLAGELYGVTPTDPWAYAGAGLVLLAVALIACWLPARRAARVDPLVSLRMS